MGTILPLTFDQVYYDTSKLELVRDNLTLQTKDLWATAMQTGEYITYDCDAAIRAMSVGRTGSWSYALSTLPTTLTQASDWSARFAYKLYVKSPTTGAWAGLFSFAGGCKKDMVVVFAFANNEHRPYVINNVGDLRNVAGVTPAAAQLPTTIYLTIDYDADGGAGFGQATFTYRSGSHSGTVLGTRTVDLSSGDTFSVDRIGISNNQYSAATTDYWTTMFLIGAPEINTGSGWTIQPIYADESVAYMRLDGGYAAAVNSLASFAPYEEGTIKYQYCVSETVYDVTDAGDRTILDGLFNGSWLTAAQMQAVGASAGTGRYPYIKAQFTNTSGTVCTRLGGGPAISVTRDTPSLSRILSTETLDGASGTFINALVDYYKLNEQWGDGGTEFTGIYAGGSVIALDAPVITATDNGDGTGLVVNVATDADTTNNLEYLQLGDSDWTEVVSGVSGDIVDQEVAVSAGWYLLRSTSTFAGASSVGMTAALVTNQSAQSTSPTTTRTNYRQHKILIYRLKRNFGQTVTLRQCTNNVNNVKTGETTRTYADYIIKRAIILPKNIIRDFSYDLSFIAANKNFTYGALYDANTRIVMLERKDLKSNGTLLDVNLDWYVVINGEQYNIKELTEYQEHNSYILVCTKTEKDA